MSVRSRSAVYDAPFSALLAVIELRSIPSTDVGWRGTRRAVFLFCIVLRFIRSPDDCCPCLHPAPFVGSVNELERRLACVHWRFPIFISTRRKEESRGIFVVRIFVRRIFFTLSILETPTSGLFFPFGSDRCLPMKSVPSYVGCDRTRTQIVTRHTKSRRVITVKHHQ